MKIAMVEMGSRSDLTMSLSQSRRNRCVTIGRWFTRLKQLNGIGE